MKVESFDQISIVNNFLNSCKEKICYLILNKEVSTKFVENNKSDYTVIDLADDFSPYKPFLRLIKDEGPDENLLKQFSYSVQTESFSTYFRTGLAVERYDIPIPNEQVYEINQFVHTITELFKIYNKKNFIFLNSQNIFSDTIQIMNKLESEFFTGRLIFCFDAEITNTSEAVLDFMEEHSTKPNFLFLKNTFAKKAKALMNPLLDYEHHFYGSQKIAEELFNNFSHLFSIIHNNRIFMSYAQLKIIIIWIKKNLQNFSFSSYQKRILYFELALDFFNCEMPDEAILYLNDIIESQNDDDLTTAALFYLARIFYEKKSNDLAKKYALQVRQRLENRKDSAYYALLAMLEFQFVKRSDPEIAKEKYLEALERLDSLGFINNYIATGLTVPWNLINNQESRPLIEDIIDTCMAIAAKNGNKHLFSTACHWKGIMSSHYGEGEDAMKWYNKCNAIRTEIGELIPLINIRNGLSYESLCRALYKDAYNQVNGIIKNVYQLNDYSRIIDCLKNIGYALFFSRHYDIAYEILSKLLHFLYLFNLDEQTNNSFLPSASDILLFMTIIDLDRNELIHAKINFAQIEADYANITMEDKPLLFFVKAALHATDRHFEESEDELKNCINLFKKIKSAQSHKICFVCYEYAVLMERLGQPELAKKYLKKGFTLAKEKKFVYYTKNKRSITTKDYLEGIEKLDELKIDLAFLNEKAEKEVLLTQLHKRIHDYQFLNKIKSHNQKSNSYLEFIENAVQNIYEYTFANSVMIGECNNGKYHTIYARHRSAEKDLAPEEWESLFSNSKNNENEQFIYKEQHNLFFGNISQADIKIAVAIIPSLQNTLSTEDLNTLNIALSSVQAQIVIYKQEENLLFLSTTDTLSLLNNRHALQQYITAEGERIRRYEIRKKTTIQIAIAFIDLDNFKFYNDTFGHNVGDILIMSFAKLLKKVCRQSDFITRFGGDEFVIVMVDTDKNEAVKVYERLIEGLKKENHFISAIKEKLGVNALEIPTKRLLGFSMGISTNLDIENANELNEVLENADKALYYSKEHQKGSCSIWSEVKDKLRS